MLFSVNLKGGASISELVELQLSAMGGGSIPLYMGVEVSPPSTLDDPGVLSHSTLNLVTRGQDAKIFLVS